MKRWKSGIVFVFGLLLFFSTNCGNPSPEEEKIYAIDLDTTLEEKNADIKISQDNELNVAVAAMISPKETMHYYEDLFNYLGEKLGKRIHFKQRKTYKEVNDLIRDKKIDFAFICSGAYVDALTEFPVEILAVPVVDGEALYQAYIIVNKDAPYKTFEDLRGKSFAFTDPLSHTGYFYVKHLLLKMGTSEEEFFSRTIFTYAHDYSIQAVSRSIVDGASVDGLIYDYLKSTKPHLVENTKIIQKSEKFGIPPIVTHRETDPLLKARIKKILLNMHLDSTGVKILKGLHVDYFTEPDPDDYKTVMEIRKLQRLK